MYGYELPLHSLSGGLSWHGFYGMIFFFFACAFGGCLDMIEWESVRANAVYLIGFVFVFLETSYRDMLMSFMYLE